MANQEGESQPERPRAQEQAEFNEFGKKLLPYFHRYILYVDRVHDPRSPSHPDRMREIGLRVRSIRKYVGLSRAELAQQMGEDPVRLAAFEGGLVPKEDLPADFPQKLSSILKERLQNLGTSTLEDN